MSSSFESIPLISPLKKALMKLNFTSMTPIQEVAIPIILDGKDLIAQASTGTGKTLAFSLGVLQNINPKNKETQAIIICPTRELSEQVAQVLRSLASDIGNVKVLTLCGGLPMKGQIHSLKHGAPIIVGTPGRLLRLLKIDALNLGNCSKIVLDEADRMIDMGFIEDIEAIFDFLPSKKQVMFFSATYTNDIKEISQRFVSEPLFANTVESTLETKTITEISYTTNDKFDTLLSVLTMYPSSNGIIFCNTKIEATSLHNQLADHKLSSILLHGDLEQFERTEAILQFKNHSFRWLISTDLAGRGIDIDGMDLVINYDIPVEEERYVHRIGRTGRAGSEGEAINILGPNDLEQTKLYKRSFHYESFSKKFSTIDSSDAPMRTVCIDAGKKDKLRAGDIVGALIQQVGIEKDELGKIDQFDHLSYVAIVRNKSEALFAKMKKSPIKKHYYRMWLLD